MTAPSEQQRAEIRSLIGRATAASDALVLSVANAYRDRRDHPAAEDQYCAHLAGWISDCLPTVLHRLLDAEAEVERLRTELAEVTAHRAHVMGIAEERVTEATELREQAEKVAAFVAQRAEVITAIRNCHPDNSADYNRWQGHAEARRVLAEQLGLPIAWPTEAGDPS